jgi:tRNA A37 N6-isopentenylltransferase MiaA
LELAELLPGRVAIFVGGTGLYPFCDLIDLLFKAEILKTADNKLKAEILALYPVLKNNPFSKFSF